MMSIVCTTGQGKGVAGGGGDEVGAVEQCLIHCSKSLPSEYCTSYCQVTVTRLAPLAIVTRMMCCDLHTSLTETLRMACLV